MTDADDRDLGLAVTVDEEGCADLSALDPVHRRYLAHRGAGRRDRDEARCRHHDG